MTATPGLSDACSPDADGNGFVDVVDIQRRASDPNCLTFLPQIVHYWRQLWPATTPTPTPTATASATATPTASATPPSFQVLLLIQEAIPDDPAQEGFQLLPGLDRDQEPVTFGLPLPEDSGISDVSQLGLSGAQVGQFRVLQRWPNSNIQIHESQIIHPGPRCNRGGAGMI
jgi:hypothetical protein